MKIGEKVYVKEHNMFGTVEEIQNDRITKVNITTPTGPVTIDTINMIVIIIKGVSGVVQLAVMIWEALNNKKKKK